MQSFVVGTVLDGGARRSNGTGSCLVGSFLFKVLLLCIPMEDPMSLNRMNVHVQP